MKTSFRIAFVMVLLAFYSYKAIAQSPDLKINYKKDQPVQLFNYNDEYTDQYQDFYVKKLSKTEGLQRKKQRK